MDDVERLMKRCQIGVMRGPNAYDELHNILSDCYGMLGRLRSELAEMTEKYQKERDSAMQWSGYAGSLRNKLNRIQKVMVDVFDVTFEEVKNQNPR